MAPRTLGLALAVAAAAACHFGSTARQFMGDYGPYGITAMIVTVQGHAVAGELLAVEDAGLLIADVNAVTRVGYAAIQNARFKQTGESLGRGRAPSPKTREALRLRSRYPQGVSEDLLQKLLAARGQTAVREYAP